MFLSKSGPKKHQNEIKRKKSDLKFGSKDFYPLPL
jgi:hypothetical protein